MLLVRWLVMLLLAICRESFELLRQDGMHATMTHLLAILLDYLGFIGASLAKLLADEHAVLRALVLMMTGGRSRRLLHAVDK